MAKVCKRNGRYVLDYYFNGERIRKSLPKDVTKKEADVMLRDIQTQIFKGLYSLKEIPTFREVSDEWQKQKKTGLRGSSFATYEKNIGNHLSVFNNLKIHTLTTDRIEAFISEKQSEGLSINTVRAVCNVLNQIMKFAVKRRYIGSNPLSAADKPRGNTGTKARVLDADEINMLLAAETDQMYHCLFKLGIFSGARVGELLGLKWSDILFTDRQIRIERTFNHGAIYEPKNRTSRRRITLGDDMMQTLREWRKADMGSGTVFHDKEGKRLDSMTVLRRFRKALKKAGLPDIRFHDLRHTFASLMLANGENIKVIQAQLGHSTPTMTLNVYSHLIKDDVSDVADRLEKAVFSASGHQTVIKAG